MNDPNHYKVVKIDVHTQKVRAEIATNLTRTNAIALANECNGMANLPDVDIIDINTGEFISWQPGTET